MLQYINRFFRWYTYIYPSEGHAFILTMVSKWILSLRSYGRYITIAVAAPLSPNHHHHHHLVNFFNRRFLTLSLAGQLTLLQKSSQPRHGYSSRRIEASSVHVWNLQNCLWSTVPIKCLSQNLYLVDLRSGQYRDLPIISLWENMEIFPVSHKPIETTQFFQDRGRSPDLCRSGSLQIPIPAEHREVT